VEAEAMAKARDTFKQQYLELKEANKDLKGQFRDIEGKVVACVTAARTKEERDSWKPV
jgi:hypothetical protein